MEKKSVMEKKMGSYGIHIIIVGIVAIVAIVAIVGIFKGTASGGGGLSSSASSFSERGDLAGQAIGDWCTDSDGGDPSTEIYIKGNAVGQDWSYWEDTCEYNVYPTGSPYYVVTTRTDSCSPPNCWLQEGICTVPGSIQTVSNRYVTCSGGCQNGVCIDAAPVPVAEPVAECTDPDCADPALEIYTKGISTQPDGATLEDTCAYEQLSAGQIMTTDIISCYPPNCKLKERKCPSSSSSLVTTEEVGCPYGCSDGACRSTADPNAPKCSATDGKGNKFIKGVCVDGVTGQVKEDSCKRNNLQQTYCTGIGTCGVDEVGYACPNGCGNGVCKGALK